MRLGLLQPTRAFAIKWSEVEWQKCKLKTIRLIAVLAMFSK